MKLLYTPEAISDLTRLREFIELKNPETAERIGQDLVQGISRLLIPKWFEIFLLICVSLDI